MVEFLYLIIDIFNIIAFISKEGTFGYRQKSMCVSQNIKRNSGIIHCLFKIHPTEDYDFFVAEWSAGELLQYYGGVLAFSGTVILGALSLHQNEIIKQESDKRIAIQEKREHDSNMPRFRVKFLYCNGRYSNMKVKIENISDNVANEILVYKICVVKDKNVIWKYPNAVKYDVIKANDELIQFKFDKI